MDKVISFPKQKSWEEKYLEELHDFLSAHFKSITKGLHICEICKNHHWCIHSKDFPTLLTGVMMGVLVPQRFMLVSCSYCQNVKHIFVNEEFSNRLLKFETEFREKNQHPSERSQYDIQG